jgi:acetyl esterase
MDRAKVRRATVGRFILKAPFRIRAGRDGGLRITRPTFGLGLIFLCLMPALVAVAPTENADLLATAEPFSYRDGSPAPMRLYVFKPAGWSSGDHRAAFVFFFGGGWSSGDPGRAAEWGRFAASLEMVGIVPDYRTKERFHTSPLASVADGRAALHWVQTHGKDLGVAPEKIIVGGDSSGGHVALWTAITKDPSGSLNHEAPQKKPAALVLFSAVSDTSPQTGYTPFRFGGDATALSPVHQLDQKMPPVLAFHGDADRTVPFRQAVALHDKLEALGNQSELIVVPDGDHGFLKEMPAWRSRSEQLLREFFIKRGLLAP